MPRYLCKTYLFLISPYLGPVLLVTQCRDALRMAACPVGHGIGKGWTAFDSPLPTFAAFKGEKNDQFAVGS